MKKVISLILVFVTILTISCVSSYVFAETLEPAGKCGENVYWSLDKNILTISGTGEMYNYDKGIESPFFPYRQSIEKVVVEEGVTSIGRNSLYGMFINKIILPKSLKSICSNAITMTSIKSLDISKNVSFIHKSNYFCLDLESINVHTDNRHFSSEAGVLFNKDKSKLLVYPLNKKGAYTVPNGVKVIGKEAFKNAGIKAISFSNSVEKIENSAFNCCGLKEIKKYPRNLKEIGNYAFSQTNLSDFRFGKNVKKAPADAFSWCERLKNFYVNKNNKNFSSSNGVVFSKNKKVLVIFPNGRKEKYNIPKSVRKIGASAFEGSKVKEITFNNKLKYIGENAFCSTNLKKVSIPSSVKEIGKYAFKYCEKLKKVEFKGNIPKIRKGAFNKFYDEGKMSDPPKTKFYVSKKYSAKSLRKKLITSGVKSAKIYCKTDGSSLEINY